MLSFKEIKTQRSQGLDIGLDTINTEELLRNNEYNLGQMLEEAHVSYTTDLLLKKFGVTLDEEQIYSLNVSESNKEDPKLLLESLLNKAKTEQKPIIMQVCNGHHWITTCLLPGGENGVTVVSMNSYDESIPADAKQMAHCKSMETNLEAEIKSLAAYKDIRIHKLDVKGQQTDNCCGLATAMNAASIIKTLQNFEDAKVPTKANGVFDMESFKNKLSNNVFYQLDDKDNLMILGESVGGLSKSQFLKTFGGSILQSIDPDKQSQSTDFEVLFTLKAIREEKLMQEEMDHKIAKALSSEVSQQEKQVLGDARIAKSIFLKGMKELTLGGLCEVLKDDKKIKETLRHSQPQILQMVEDFSKSQNVFSLIINYVFYGNNRSADFEKKFQDTLDKMIKELEPAEGSKSFVEKIQNQNPRPISVC